MPYQGRKARGPVQKRDEELSVRGGGGSSPWEGPLWGKTLCAFGGGGLGRKKVGGNKPTDTGAPEG